ncbi:hypothetical protein [Actibacterium sp. XHP0104]|uniref:hypothetical protein n=1 Tax=Actibacterium sp. XHP0104 TaxID=2984335 RepID=UPI0021E76BEF|nr:hypothetical protein [Actibacterium sp. XHP0104]MCV2882037.1 hypothetical protein [Actibacterium sp. XHP0104]
MASYDNSYSRFIAWAKVILPLAALALLSTLFLFSRTLDPTAAIPYAQVDVEELAREQSVSSAEYAGVTEDGAAISISAARVDPSNADRPDTLARDMTARLEFPDGSYAVIRAPQGQVDARASVATLGGGVEMDSSTGYHITAPQIDTALDRTEVQADGPVDATGPAGTLTAGQMQITTQTTDDGDSHVLVFNQGVKLIYQPPN